MTLSCSFGLAAALPWLEKWLERMFLAAGNTADLQAAAGVVDWRAIDW